MSWLYEDKGHSIECSCDQCEGHTYIERHVPDDCLFDDNDVVRRYQDDPKQHRKGWWE